MTTFSTNTTIANDVSANFQAWVNEIYNALVTNCGLTQTADTGQMAVPCTTALTGANTASGYYVFRFNDTLQATSPVFIKLECGQGSVTTGVGSPLILITVGSSTNGAGTITGLISARSACTASNTGITGGGTTNCISRYCYNATQGYLGVQFKLISSPNSWGGFHIYRSVDNTGAPTATAVNIINNVYNVTNGSGSNLQTLSYIDYVTSAVGQTGLPSPSAIVGSAFGITSAIVGTTTNIFPCLQWAPTLTTPGAGYTNTGGLIFNTDVGIGSTFTATVIGTTSLTYINIGVPCGCNQIFSLSTATYGFAMLWQ